MAITVVKCGADGVPVWRYEGELAAEGDGWVCLHAYFNVDDRDDGYFKWQRGDLFVEYYFADRYYNINKIYDRDSGALRGWYCNIARPARWEGGVLKWDDLELDVFIHADGDLLLKDEEGFQALELAPEERAAALHALNELMDLAMTGAPPFDIP